MGGWAVINTPASLAFPVGRGYAQFTAEPAHSRGRPCIPLPSIFDRRSVMRRIVVIIALLAVVGIGGFLYLFKREMVKGWFQSARGYPDATTPQECVDNFKKAVAARNYDMAAKYCTKDYAEQLKKGADAGKELGTAIDDLTHRMKNDGVLTTEIEWILWLNDPAPDPS